MLSRSGKTKTYISPATSKDLKIQSPFPKNLWTPQITQNWNSPKTYSFAYTISARKTFEIPEKHSTKHRSQKQPLPQRFMGF